MSMTERSLYETQQRRLSTLLRRFEREYGDTYVLEAQSLKQNYPDLTRRGRRTGRALRNICFFVWCYTRHEARPLVPTLFKASVLLSAQDDYYDNPRISAAQKDDFCSATNRFLRADSLPTSSGTGRQVQELTSLWSEVARGIPRVPREVYDHWSDKACQLNEAMAAENRTTRQAHVSFDQYMQTAVHSVGILLIWSTYLVHKNVPLETMRGMDPALLRGARIVRLSNDIASYRQAKDKRNAVILLGEGPGAERQVARIMEREAGIFRDRLHALRVGADVERAILCSTEFLRAFYVRSDFDKRVPW